MWGGLFVLPLVFSPLVLVGEETQASLPPGSVLAAAEGDQTREKCFLPSGPTAFSWGG